MSKSLTVDVLKRHMNEVFVETGTYQGGGVLVALLAGFKEIHSIEIYKPFYNTCCDKFKSNKKVNLYCGDSLLCLWDIIKDIDKPITFWLDGHIHKNIAGQKNIPILEELETIAKHSIKTHKILVDDRRVMGTKVWDGITEQQVIKAILKVNSNYVISYEDSRNGANDIVIGELP